MRHNSYESSPPPGPGSDSGLWLHSEAENEPVAWRLITTGVLIGVLAAGVIIYVANHP